MRLILLCFSFVFWTFVSSKHLRADDFTLLSGPLTVTDYSAFHCGPCRTLHHNVLKEVIEHYRWTDKVKFRFVFGSINSQGPISTRKAVCAVREGAPLELVNGLLFSAPESSLETISLKTMAGLSELESCMSDERSKNLVDKMAEEIRSKGVRSFPTLYIGDTKIQTPSTPQALIRLIDSQN